MQLHNRQNPTIQQNCRNFCTNDAIFISFEIYKALNLCNRVYFMTGSPTSNRAQGVVKPWEDNGDNDLISYDGVFRAVPGFAWVC